MPQKPYKHSPHTPPLLVWQQPDHQNVTAEQIPDRQRLDALSVRRSEPAFKIHGPDMVGASGFSQPVTILSGTARRTALVTATAQFPSLQPPRYRPHRRDFLAGKIPAQMRPDLPGSPAPMAATHAPDSTQPRLGRTLWRISWPPCPVTQPASTLSQKTRHPFVSCFTADVKKPTGVGNRFLVFQHHFYKTSARLYQRNRFPGHAPEKPTNPTLKCNLCLCPQV